jgi:2',3'-cyclic-nucleotide 2'-phosphodiesterase (5'-nucleotidase family)
MYHPHQSSHDDFQPNTPNIIVVYVSGKRIKLETEVCQNGIRGRNKLTIKSDGSGTPKFQSYQYKKFLS